MLDLIIRGGTVHDGLGGAATSADIGIRDGRIETIGKVASQARETLDASGALVMPGFVDIHTHYDGQASWDETFSPSIYHGVTTVVMGNCGVGFAPVRKGEEERLVQLMEGVEEIPGAVLAEGVRWGWESFSDYANVLGGMRHSLDFMTLVPHDCLRLFVMGERAAQLEPATADDRTRMRALLREALKAGAAGFSTGRTDNHRTAKGQETPAATAAGEELLELACAFQDLPYRVMHAVSDFDCMRGDPEGQRSRFDAEYDLLESVARATGRPLALTWLERVNAPQQWHWLAERAVASKSAGLDIRLQTACRAIGVLNGLDTSFNVFMALPTYQEFAALPLPERAARMRDPAIKTRILADKPVKLARDGSPIPPLVDQVLAQLDQMAALMFPLAVRENGPDYEPLPTESFAARAAARNVKAFEAIYDYLAEGDGGNLVYFPIFNYLRGSLESVRTMLEHPQALHALSDAGAHVGTVCDASFPTSLLAHWSRDRLRGPKLPLEKTIEMLTSRNARHMGLADRGVLKEGMRADINVIDYAKLGPLKPEIVRDLPAGGKRFVQKARGYVATLVNGAVVCREGEITGARPGRWAKGPG